MRPQLTPGDKDRIETALTSAGFTEIAWHRHDQFICVHSSRNKMRQVGAIIRNLGFETPVSGIDGTAFCQVWKAQNLD